MNLKPKKVLIVKLNQLGDTVAFLPTIIALRKGWPTSHLTLLTTKIGEQLVQGSKLVDEVSVATIGEVKTLRGFLRWLRIVKRARFDMAVASSDSSSFIALLFFISQIPIRVGFTNPKLSFLYNQKISFSKDITHTKLNLRAAERFGLLAQNTRPKIGIQIPEDDKRYILQKLSKYGISKSDQFVVLHIGSNRPSRRWPTEQFAELVNLIVEKHSVKIICIGGSQEKKLVSSLQTLVIGKPIVDMTGETNIKQLIYLISLAALFIGHSSGPLHIAYMMGTPTVSLWGASSLAIWGPVWEKEKHRCVKVDELNCLYCEQDVCPKGTLECMKLITAQQVYREVKESLQLS